MSARFEFVFAHDLLFTPKTKKPLLSLSGQGLSIAISVNALLLIPIRA